MRAGGGSRASGSDLLDRRGLGVHRGPRVSTGAVVRETEEILGEWNRGGYLGVELEASALFALADWMKIRCTMALLVTDSPVRGDTPGGMPEPKRQAYTQGIIDSIGSPELSA